MSEKPVFSIIVPVYKVEEYLEQCVRSLTGQTFSDIEIILVDDGSPDRCGEMCDAYASRDQRIQVIHKENGGQADARNVGIEAATGEYIVFVDSDDYLSEDALEKLLPYAKRNCDIIVMDGICEDGEKRVEHYVGDHDRIFTGPEYLKAAFHSGSMPMANWLYIYRRGFLQEEELRYLCGVVHEDDHFVSRAFLRARRVVDSGVKEYHYIIREDSTTTHKDLRKNGRDIYTVCLDLTRVFHAIEDRELKDLMMDSLVVKYLHIFQAGRLYQYGDEFIHKAFVKSYARKKKTKAKAALFSLSPRLYWQINHWQKKVSAKKNL